MNSRVTQKTTLLILAIITLICGVHGIGYAQLPSFSSSTATRSIAENTVAGTEIGNPVTADNFNSSTDRYRLSTDTTDSPDTDSFDIDSATGQLKTKAALDYETKTSYTVVIIVERNQGGTWTEATSGSSVTVTISVTDIPMRFINDEGQIIDTAYPSVPENVPPGTNIGAPFVVQDPEPNMVYAITDPFTNTHHNSFDMGNDGQLKTKIPLNYEAGVEYKFKIRAFGRGGSGQTDILDEVIVNVLDVNEGPPAFTEGESTTRSVIEGTPAGENIGEPVEAEDIDTDATVTYSLSGTDANAFRIDPMTGQLLTFASLDYETEKRYQVTVTASDGELESEIEVTINVEDLVPTFIEQDPATRTIAENTARGVNIGDPVTATGPDVGYALTYSLSGTDAASFDIDNTNGQLITKAALNYEAKSAYTVTVSVSDGNHPADTITVNINVQNQTEGNPTFPMGTPTTYTVPENTPEGIDIGFPVAAINLPASFMYTLTGTDRTAFTLDPHTGQLRTSASLNYEAKNSYSVTVNLGYTPVDMQLFVTHNITIQVENVNEAPMFPGESVPRSIPENTESDTNIGAPVTAMDPDIAGMYTDANPNPDDNDAIDALEYSLSGTDAAAFTLDSATGQLKTKSGVVYDYETKDTYRVTVSVTDGEFTDEIAVIISITDTTDTVPTVVITAPPTTQRGAFDVMVTFSEPVNGFDDAANDITLTTTLTEGTGNATASIESGSDGDIEYRVKITPPSDAEGNVTISVPADAATNTGNTGNAASIESHVSIDTKRPTVTMPAFSGNATGRYLLSINFSEDIDPDTFTVGEIAIQNKRAATLTRVTDSSYILSVTPSATGIMVITVPKDAAHDAAGNGNKVGPISGAQVALGAPNVTINAPTATQTGPFDITITFSEEINDFDEEDISLTGTASAAVTRLTDSLMDSVHTYTATITPMGSGDVIIQVPANAVVDDDNNGNNASQTHTVTVSLTGPTVTVTNVPTTPQNGNFNVTITFSESVTGFAATDISLGSNVSATVHSLSGSGTTYTASIRLAAGVEEELRIYVPENVATNSANQGNIASNLETVRVDTVVPTVTMVDAPEIANSQFAVTFTFREDVTLADATKISITGVTYTHQVTITDNSLTVTITPTTDGTLRVKANAGVVKDGAGNLNLASQQYTVQIDTTAPTVTIRDVPTALQSRAFTVKVKFSEPVSGFMADDITLTATLTEGTGNATASIESGSDGDSEYTVKITPPADVVGEIAVSVPAEIAQDAAQNDNTASSESTVQVDTIRPTATITIPTGAQKGAFQVGIEFSEPVSGFTRTGTPPDITLTGVPATVTSLTADPDAMVSGTKYIATINPTEKVNLSWVGVQVRANAAQDAAGNGNTASSTRTVPVKTKRPEVEEIELPEGEQNGEFNVRIRFDSAVSNFESADITLGGTVNATVTVFGGVRTTYTATVTPEAGEVDGTVTVQVGANVAEDVAGNGNIASSVYTVQVDTISPTVRITAPSTAGGAFNATIIFNETVTGFDDPATDITLGGTAAATVTNLTGSGTTYTAAITPTSNGSVEITVPADAAFDAAGNGNAALTTKTTVIVTLTGPSVAITGVPTTPQKSAFDVTITFSESVTGFAATDISLGTNVSATKTLTGSGASYTATITPAANVEEEITISVPANAATNASNMGNTASTAYTVQLDTISPTLTITAPSTAHRTFDITITFREDVSDFTKEDITLGGTAAATVDSLTGSGKDYTTTIIPTSDGDLEISVPANAAQDTAGNGNTASQTQTVTISLTSLAFDEGTSTDRSIVENTRTGVNIGDPVTATDVDNLTLTYSLSSTTDAVSDYQLFDINASNGQLRTDAALNYETKNSYEVTVEVTNGTDTVSIIVTINVTNENEAPMFPATTATTLEIIENPVAGTNIGVVAAADPDIAGSYTDANPDDDGVDALTYSLGGTNAAAFDIDSGTGQLKTKAALNYETKNSYTVRVFVSDGSTDTDSITVTINVEDDNEAPMFSSETTTRTVSEDTGTGVNIGAPVTATDPDTTDGDTDVNPETMTVDSLIYSLLNANDPNSHDAAFDIDPGTGQLKTKAALDYEDRSQYMVTVRAFDGELDDTITVTIDIDDVDDAQPTVTDIELPTGVQNDTFSVKIIFDEPVTLTGSGNITTADSVSRVYSLSGSGTTHTATFSRVNGKVGDVILKVPAGFAKDGLNNLNIESDTYTVPVDWENPTVTIDAPSGIQGGGFDVTITFSEAVTGFTPSDDILLSGTATATAALKTGSDGDSVYTVTITPTGDGSVIIQVRANVVEDNAGNGNTASQSPHPSVTVDLTAPTVTIAGVPDNANKQRVYCDLYL